ncbi:hypothetical protein [uncultured Roseobacter sp.]|uniref:hypothetical protein n=1 Tax=uncultured Roseobacter sp. TaxID=114847 RepID=UPI0026325015|nr:hypothetical protein [uncultured Roseobacter sp.]
MSPTTLVAVMIAVVSTLVYLLLALDIMMPWKDTPYWGMDIYNYQAIGILNGTLEMPVRIIGYEGHYAPDGTAVSYHGIAPILTRLIVAPFMDLNNPAISGASIWFWCTLGAVFYHLSFHQVAARYWPEESFNRMVWFGVLSFMVWVTAPTLLMVVAVPFYHEPIALSYAMAAICVFCMVRYHFFDAPLSKILIPMGICAAMTVHARPNLALGLLLGTGFLCLVALIGRDRMKMLIPIAVSGTIMVGSLAGFMVLNSVKFGSAGKVHGTYEDTGVQYGPVFWGFEERDSPRASAFIEHGRFNAKRILPNLAMYTFAPPRRVLKSKAPYRKALIAYRKVTTPMLGFIRIYMPTAGAFYLWTGWFALVLLGFRRTGIFTPGGVALLGTTAVPAVVTLSYGTISLRYSFDMWPFLMALAIFSLPAACRSLMDKSTPRKFFLLGCAALVFGLYISLISARTYNNGYQRTFGQVWTYEECAERVAEKGLPSERLATICAL